MSSFLEGQLRGVAFPAEEPFDPLPAIVGQASDDVGIGAGGQRFRKGQAVDLVEEHLRKAGG